MRADNVISEQSSDFSNSSHLAPLSVNLVLTSKCNYQCKFCFAKFESKHMLFDYRYILDIPCILKDMGTSKFTIEGGEPFILPRLLKELLIEAKNCGLTTMVITNGSLVRKKFLEELSPYLDWLGVSIDSSREETELLLGRGYGNHISKIKKIAKWTHELGILLKTNTVVTRYNVNDDLSSLLIQMMPRRAKFFQYLHIPGVNNEYSNELKIDVDEFWQFVERHRIIEEYGISIAAETNEDMLGSYLMMFPDGRFFNNNNGSYHYTEHTIFENPQLALKEAKWLSEKFIKRKGIYSWRKEDND